MATHDQFVNLVDKRLLGFLDFRDRLLGYLKKYARDIHQTAYGMNGIFGGNAVVPAAHGAGRIQFSIDPLCSDGVGHFLQTTTDDLLNGRTLGIPFENTNTVLYYLGYHYAERPRTIQINSSTGLPEFVAFEETIGQSNAPGTAVNNGANMTFNVDVVCQPFGGAIPNYNNRTCLVWKNAPGRLALTEAAAVEACVVAFAAGHNTITTVGLLGQPGASVSVLPGDYTVLLLGPTISSTNNLSITAAYTFIGTVTGNGGTPTVFSIAGQNALASGFAVDLSQIARLDPDGHLKVRVQAVVGDVNVRQIEVDLSGGTPVWWIDELGNMIANGTSSLAGNVTIGTTHANLCTLHGRLTQLSDGASTLAQLLETGELGVRGPAITNVALKTWLRSIIGDDDAQLHDLRGDLRAISNGSTTVAEIRSSDGRMASGGVVDATYQFRTYGDVSLDQTTLMGRALLLSSASTDAQVSRESLGALTHPYALKAVWRNADTTFTRVYATNTGSYLTTINAFNDGSGIPGVWSKDLNGTAASAVQHRADFFAISQRLAGNNANWSTWDIEHTIPVGSAAAATLAASIFPDAVGRSLGSSPAQAWDAALRNITLSGTIAGDMLFSAARPFRKTRVPRSEEQAFVNGHADFLNFLPGSTVTSYHQFTVTAGGNPTSWQEIWKLDLPQNAQITNIIIHWRTGTTWTATDSFTLGGWRQHFDHSGTMEYFDPNGGGVGVPGFTTPVIAPGTNLTDRHEAAIVTAGAATAPIDNATYDYFLYALITGLGSTGVDSSRIYTAEIRYTMDRAGVV